jgi:hypothetical protein
LSAVEHHGGFNVQAVDLGDDTAVAQYLNKIGRELTGEHTKTARGLGNFTALELFEEFRATGNMAYLDRWQEYEQASHRRKRITTSEGPFTKYGVAAARTDEDIVRRTRAGRTSSPSPPAPGCSSPDGSLPSCASSPSATAAPARSAGSTRTASPGPGPPCAPAVTAVPERLPPTPACKPLTCGNAPRGPRRQTAT